MSIKYKITTKNKLPEVVDKAFTDYFNLSDDVAGIVRGFISPLKRQCNFFVEYPYVDKVYRNSYYNFYSSKLRKYRRNCIRISIFTTKINNGDFRSDKSLDTLEKHYRGFFVIRPTLPSPIGRAVISPEALSSNNFLTCTTQYPGHM
ncbi:MAG: hypothetical protein U5K00_22765 [Melioribacteraceae bacterium]|nr:hypothetical protein [Melioribacteraceae bacterium]